MGEKWFKLNPLNGLTEEIHAGDVEAYISMRSEDKNIDINNGGYPIKCRNDIWVISSKTTKEQISVVINEYSHPSEEWRRITMCPKPYFVSNLGRVKVVYKSGKHKILSQYFKSGRNKLTVKLPIGDKKYKEEHVYQLVARAFLINSDNLPCVYHKDGNINNNRSKNLKWIDRKELGHVTGGWSNSLPVLKIDAKTEEVLDAYESMAEAGRQNYLHRETIRLCVNGELKTAGGFLWKVDKEFKKNKTKLRGI